LRYLREHPLCVVCGAEDRTEAATVVDHIVAHKGDERLFWDAANHRAVCRRHHDERVDEGDFGR
jgi:5-methylcytosine-specific restriction protein A